MLGGPTRTLSAVGRFVLFAQLLAFSPKGHRLFDPFVSALEREQPVHLPRRVQRIEVGAPRGRRVLGSWLQRHDVTH